MQPKVVTANGDSRMLPVYQPLAEMHSFWGHFSEIPTRVGNNAGFSATLVGVLVDLECKLAAFAVDRVPRSWRRETTMHSLCRGEIHLPGR
jgi:hypothetical protein